MRYLPNSPADRQAMLAATGHAHIDELFQQIHADLRLKGKLNLPGPLSESEILDFFRQAAAETTRDYVSLLGAGAYWNGPVRTTRTEAAIIRAWADSSAFLRSALLA